MYMWSKKLFADMDAAGETPHFVLKVTLFLSLVLLQGQLGSRRGSLLVAGSEPDIWPFDNLNKDMEVHGNARHEQSPVGTGLYLDGTTGTYVKLKGYDEKCLEHPSNCNITIGFFLKLMPKSGWQIFFGNKDANETLYEGVNVYFKDSFQVMVYGKDKYCSRVISPPLGVWFYLGLVWEQVGKLAVYVDSWYSQSFPPYHCGRSPNGLKTRGDYYLGRHTYPIAYYKDLNIWYSKEPISVFNGKLNAALDNGPDTEIGLKIVFRDLVYDSGRANQWRTGFSNKVNEIFTGDAYFMEIKNISVSESDGNAAVSFTLKFKRVIWKSMLTLQLAVENGTFFGYPGFLDERSCQNKDNDNFVCEAPKNAAALSITHNSVTVTINPVSVPQSNDYFYGYRILYKNLEDPESQWVPQPVVRRNVPPIMSVVHHLRPYTHYSFRVSAVSFQSEGLISDALDVRTAQWVPSVGPVIVGYRSTSSTSIYVQWNHSIPQEQANGILIGYRVAWDDDHFSSDHPDDSQGYADVGLDTSMYDIFSLYEHWLYNIRVAGRTSVGHGIYTVVTVMTEDSTPSAPPSDVDLNMANESALHVHWNDVQLTHQDGVILGYRLKLQKEDGSLVVWNITVGADVHGYTFSDLLIFQNYSIQILAFTIKGDGPLSEKVYQMTDESFPINSPVNLTARNVSSREIEVTWGYNEDPRLVLGDLQGFLLYFLEANASDYFTENSVLKTHNTDTRRSTRVGGLEIFRLYNISVAARTAKGHGPRNESVIIRTHGEAPGASPESLTCYNTSTSSIYASWQEIVEDKQHGIMEGYKLFFFEVTKEGSLQSMENHTFDLAVHETTFTGLKTYTKYRIEVLGFNNFGDGPAAAVELFTDESAPSHPPSNLTVQSGNSTSLSVKWTPVPECCHFGIIKGYHVTLTDSNNSSVTITKNFTDLEARFVNLKKFNVYQISVNAFTSKGAGPKICTSVSTDQDVPQASPRNFTGYNISQTAIQLLWAPVPKDKANGFVIGYNVSLKEADGIQPTRHITFDSSNLQAVIGWLKPFTVYKLNVRAFTIKGNGPPSDFITVKTEEEAPQAPPSSFQGINSGSTSILLRWDPIPQDLVAGVQNCFTITYRQLDTADSITYNITVPITSVTVEITNLRKYTNYSFDIKDVTKLIGAATQPIVITTDEDVPSLPPQIIKLQNSSSTGISVQWRPIPNDQVNGILLGIKLVYRSALRDNSMAFSSRARRSTEEDWSEYNNIILAPGALSYEMTSLKKFTNYRVAILGFTSKGDGNVSHQFVVSTDEDVPSMPPSSFLHTLSSEEFKMSVTWAPVPDGFVHGILLGYRIYYVMTQETGGKNASSTEVITVGPHEQSTTVTLNKFAKYTLEIAAFTIKGDGVKSKIKYGSTCNCPRVFKTTWYPLPPYITYEDGAVGGFIPRILEDAVEYCCSDCLLPNGRSASVINFDLDGRGSPARKSGVEELISSIDNQTDFSVPVNVHRGQIQYSLYSHVELAESSGVAFIAVIDHKVKGIVVQNLFLETWPLLLLTSIMMLAVGIIMCIMETRSNEAEFPRSFFQGASEGFWWAFITSTTVGYGDRCPRGVLSRVFAIVWALCGLVVLAILTGEITSALTDYKHLETNIELYGAEVAAIANNSDFRLGVLKSARMNTVRSYQTYEEIREALRNGEVSGALVDLYVLSSHKHLFDDPRFRLVRVYDYKASYGVVLAGHSMKLERCFTEYTKANAEKVFRRIEQNINSLKEPDFDLAEQQSISLFNVKSTKYVTTVIIIMALLLLACMLGIIYESRRRKISTVLRQSKDVKREMSPVVKCFLESFKKNVEALSERHRQERYLVMQVEREHDQEAADAVNKYYKVLSLRDIREEWSQRRKPLKSKVSSLSSKRSCNPTQWPFTEATNNALTNAKLPWKPSTLPLRRKYLFDPLSHPVTLEANVRIVDETRL